MYWMYCATRVKMIMYLYRFENEKTSSSTTSMCNFIMSGKFAFTLFKVTATFQPTCQLPIYLFKLCAKHTWRESVLQILYQERNYFILDRKNRKHQLFCKFLRHERVIKRMNEEGRSARKAHRFSFLSSIFQ